MATYSRLYADFKVAGMRYYDGLLVLGEMKPGDEIALVPEFDNHYDDNAIALYYHDRMIGYVPRAVNAIPAQLLRFGHSDVFECRVLAVDTDADTYDQLHVGLYVTDHRKEA
ncbi:MAG: HIRAN domain-containing protein [Eggerthellaceae bacterium]|nr:HIRAN domain-containing protein [Eggerthellaceae bacterium]